MCDQATHQYVMMEVTRKVPVLHLKEIMMPYIVYSNIASVTVILSWEVEREDTGASGFQGPSKEASMNK